MSLLTGITAASSALNTASSVANTAWNIYAQNKTWDREDSAVQRRSADLEKAGLSKTLATGSAASTSSPIQIGTPKTEIAEKALSAIQMQKNFAQADAQIALTKQQAKSLELDNQVKEHDNKLLIDSGIMKNTPDGINPTLMQGVSLGQKWLPTIKTWWDNLKNAWKDKPIEGVQESGIGPRSKFSPKANDFINGKWNNLTGGVASSTAVGEDSKDVYRNWRLNSNERMQEYYMNQGKNGSFGNKYR